MGAYQANEQTKRFIKLILLVRKRPGMYFSPINLNSLRNFLSGYNASNFLKGEKDILNDSDPDFFTWLSEEHDLRISPRTGWVEALEEKYPSPDQAFDCFFEYLLNYLKKYKNAPLK